MGAVQAAALPELVGASMQGLWLRLWGLAVHLLCCVLSTQVKSPLSLQAFKLSFFQVHSHVQPVSSHGCPFDTNAEASRLICLPPEGC